MRTNDQTQNQYFVMCCCQAVCINTVLFSMHYDT